MRGQTMPPGQKERKQPWGMGLVKWVNPWYCMIFLVLMYGYVWYSGRALHHLIGRDISIDVERVVDGDTFWGLTVPDGTYARFRLKQIDAPEHDQPFGAEAGKKLHELLLVPNREVIVFIWEQDDWGRYVVDVVTRDSIFTNLTYVNEEMVRSGMAWSFGGFAKDNGLRQAMQEAQIKKIGLWRDEHPEEPWRHRRIEREKRKSSGWFGGKSRSQKEEARKSIYGHDEKRSKHRDRKRF